jgi:hypothetical protein
MTTTTFFFPFWLNEEGNDKLSLPSSFGFVVMKKATTEAAIAFFSVTTEKATAIATVAFRFLM